MDSTYEGARTNVTVLTGEGDFPAFENDLTAYLDTKMLSRFIEKRNAAAPVVDPSKPETASALETWEDKSRAVCGYIWRHLDASVRNEFAELYSKKNAYNLWEAIETRHRSKRPGQRFQAMYDELAVTLKDDENLVDLCSHVQDASRERKRYCPKGYTLDDFDNEFDAAIWMRALPEEYSSLASTIYVANGGKPLTMDTIRSAASIEDDQQRTRGKPPRRVHEGSHSRRRRHRPRPGPVLRQVVAHRGAQTLPQGRRTLELPLL